MKTNNIYISIRTAAFSGATLTSFLLATHPDVSTIAELSGLIHEVDPNTYQCSCGTPIGRCEFWHDVSVAMAERGWAFDVATNFNTQFELSSSSLLRRLRSGTLGNNTLESIRDQLWWSIPSQRRHTNKVVSRNEALVDSILSLTDGKVFVDTSKMRVRFRALKQFSSLDIYAIQLIRDIRGIAASNILRNREVNISKLATDWVKTHTRAERDLESLPPHKRLRIRYEDLCQETKATLAQAYALCDLDSAQASTDFRSFEQHIIGNAMRLNNQSEIKLDERWKDVLSTEQLRTIDKVAGNLREKYRYEF